MLARTLLKKDDTCSKGLDAAAYTHKTSRQASHEPCPVTPCRAKGGGRADLRRGRGGLGYRCGTSGGRQTEAHNQKHGQQSQRRQSLDSRASAQDTRDSG